MPEAAENETSPDGRWEPPDLAGRVAVVTGGSRGVGRGIALALGDAGATVYVTGRSTRDAGRTEGLPGTVDDTADEVTKRGGQGIAVRCDHHDDEQVEALFARIAAEQDGRLDLLVNNAWSGYERSDEARFDAPFWQQPMWRYDAYAASVRAQFTASRHAAALMLPRDSGLIVTISYTDGDTYLGQAAYDMFKAASDRLSRAMAGDLRKTQISSIGLHPGFVRTERVEAAWSALGSGPAAVVHSAEYVGRAIAHLAADPVVRADSGHVLAVGDLAQRYGFSDTDGRRPPAFKLEGMMSLATRMERLNKVIAAQKRAAES